MSSAITARATRTIGTVVERLKAAEGSWNGEASNTMLGVGGGKGPRIEAVGHSVI
jgi:hypothetical protein